MLLLVRYTLENDKNVKVELLSIGARLNSLKLSPTGSELVPGFTSTQVDNTNGSGSLSFQKVLRWSLAWN